MVSVKMGKQPFFRKKPSTQQKFDFFNELYIYFLPSYKKLSF